MNLKPKHIQPIIMSGIMACLMTGIVTWLNLGFPENFFALWLHGFLIAWPLAACAAFVAIPLSVKLTSRILKLLGAEQR